MENKDMPAMPLVNENGAPHFVYDLAMTDSSCTGLTKREMFAMNAMQGLLSDGSHIDSYKTAGEWRNNVIEASVEFADALLEELSK